LNGGACLEHIHGSTEALHVPEITDRRWRTGAVSVSAALIADEPIDVIDATGTASLIAAGAGISRLQRKRTIWSKSSHAARKQGIGIYRRRSSGIVRRETQQTSVVGISQISGGRS